MDLRRLRAGEVIAAAAGAALLLSLFLPWYGDAEAGAEADGALSGFQALGVVDVVLALIAASAVGLLVVTAVQRVPAVPIALDALVTVAGTGAVALVLIRVLSIPEGAQGREWALWLAFAGAVGIVVGAGLAMRDERLSPPGRTTDATGRPAPAAREIEARPAPR